MSARANTYPARTAAHAFFTPRWLLTTLLVLLAAAVMVRLGIWQLDRLDQRRTINRQYTRAMQLPPLDLNQPLLADLSQEVYRDAVVTGEYDYSGEVLLRNQAWEDRPGYHLLTPLRIDGSDRLVLVDRGWIPLDDGSVERRAEYQQAGRVRVTGRLMPAQPEPRFGGLTDPALTPGQARLDAWNWVNLGRIGLQLNRPLLPLYLIAAPEPGSLTQRSLPSVDLSEGSHMSYALQWFTFALILLAGYPFYVRRQLHHRQTSP